MRPRIAGKFKGPHLDEAFFLCRIELLIGLTVAGRLRSGARGGRIGDRIGARSNTGWNTWLRWLCCWHGTLQRGLSRSIQQATTVCGRVINELPFVVMVLLVEFADSFIFAGADHSHDGSAAKNFAAELIRLEGRSCSDTLLGRI